MTPVLLAALASIAVLAAGAQLMLRGEAVGLAGVRAASLLLPNEMARTTREEWSRHVLDLAAEGYGLAAGLWGLRSLAAAVRIAVPTDRESFRHRFPGWFGIVEATVMALCLIVGVAVLAATAVGAILTVPWLVRLRAWYMLVPAGLVLSLAILASRDWADLFRTAGFSRPRPRPRPRAERAASPSLDPQGPSRARTSSGAASVPATDAAPAPGPYHLHLPSGKAEMVRRGPIDLLFLNSCGRPVDAVIGADQGQLVDVAEKVRPLQTSIGAVHVTNLGDTPIRVDVTEADEERTSDPKLTGLPQPELLGS